MTLIQIPANVPILPGCKFDGQSFNPEGLYTVDNTIRTPQGSVDQYDVTYSGVLVEPAATNYLLNTATPATQTTGSLAVGTYTIWIEGAGSAAVTAGTATIADNGTATDGSPDTFTVSVAGTVTVTVTDPVTFFQLENNAFPTSHIPTTDSTVTRAADNVTFATPSWLVQRKNDIGIFQRIKPVGAGQTAHTLCSYTDANGEISIVLGASSVTFRKRVGGTDTDVSVSYTHAADTLFEVAAYQSSVQGMGLAVRSHDGSSWSAWPTWGVDASTANAVIAATTRIGSQTDSTSHTAASVPMTRILRIPTNLSAAGLQAWLVAKATEGD